MTIDLDALEKRCHAAIETVKNDGIGFLYLTGPDLLKLIAIARFAHSWATTEADIDGLLKRGEEDIVRSLEEAGLLEAFNSCGQCGWSGRSFHACPGLPGENQF